MTEAMSDPRMREERLQALEQRLGHTFTNKELLVEALSHASSKQEGFRSNERLEFLGDAVLGFIVSEVLYARYPDLQEGDLTRQRMLVVSRRWLDEVGDRLGLREFIALGKGLSNQSRNMSQGRRLLADAMEAVIGAIHLDGGIEPVRTFITTHILCPLREERPERKDYKTLLQHYAQRHLAQRPSYRVTAELGPDHRKEFAVVAVLGGREFPPARGTNKKEAEQGAARAALAALREHEPDP